MTGYALIGLGIISTAIGLALLVDLVWKENQR
jgi:hypothetical protein